MPPMPRRRRRRKRKTGNKLMLMAERTLLGRYMALEDRRFGAGSPNSVRERLAQMDNRAVRAALKRYRKASWLPE